MTDPSSVDSFKYRAFISYSHDDEKWAKWLQNALENYRLPARLVGTQTAAGLVPRRLGVLCRDRSDLSSAPDLSADILTALTQSANLIVICSPSASKSRWVNKEIEMFIELGRSQRIFCFIVAGEPNASDPSRECFPPAARFIYGLNGEVTGRRHPIAADARAGRDGKLNAKLKIIAGLLAVDFDLLKQREHRRHVRRLIAVTSAALVVTVITAVLAIEAVLERNQAVTARHAAERRQKQAEDLVDFMLGDLNEKLRHVQRLDILEAVDNRAMLYFQSMPTADVTDQTIAQRVNALQKIGRIRADQGKLPAALDSYRSAAALAEELLRRAPQDPARQAAYAGTLNFIGNAYWFQGDLPRALSSFQQAVSLLEQATQQRGSDDWLTDLASARTNEGRVLEAQGDLKSAKQLYEAVLATFVGLAARDTPSDRWQGKLADGYDSLGKLELEQGRLPQAITAYRDVRRLREQLYMKASNDRALQEDLLISDAILGRALFLCGNINAAEDFMRASVTSARVLVGYDATQVDWQEELADYSRLLGGLSRSAGELDTAGELDAEALRILTALVATDPTNASWRRDLANAQMEKARLLQATGELNEAERLLKSALGTVEEDRRTSLKDRGLELMEAQARVSLGQIASQRGESTVAHEQWLKARDVVTPAAQVGADPNFLSAWASALLLLDDGAARSVVDRLASMGYSTPDFRALLALKKQTYSASSMEQRCGMAEQKVSQTP
jgi:tetratricopeptide (TPR) repeat protein